MNFIRARQSIMTRLFPHQGNRAYIACDKEINRPLPAADPVNLFLSPSDWTNAAWIKTGSAIDSGPILAPDGTPSAKILGTTGVYTLSQVAAVAAGVWCLSCFAWGRPSPSETSVVNIGAPDNTQPGAPALYVPVAGQWARYWRNVTIAAHTGAVSWQIAGQNGTPSEVALWGFQLTAGAGIKKYTAVSGWIFPAGGFPEAQMV